jgi:DHA2 family multidrug resistance protein
MELKDLFYSWVPLYIRLPVLYILFLVILVANGVFLSSIADIYSDLAVESEPFTQAYNAMYIGMGLGLIAHVRLKMRFSNKTLLIGGLLAMLLTNIICATTASPALAIAACLVLGFAKISALIEVYLIWIYIWSKKLDTSRVYPFVYFTALSGLYLMYWVNSRLAYVYNWRYAYLLVIILLLICLVFALLFTENHPLRRKLPLYRLDVTGLFFLGGSMMALNYAVVCGQVEDWFNSGKVIMAFYISGIFLLAFISRELTARHPIFDLGLFKKRTFRLGIFYLLLLALFTPGTMQSAFAGGVLHYETYRIMQLNLYLIPGVFASCVFCYGWYYFKLDAEPLIFLGFLSFLGYHLMMYYGFSNEFTIGDFWWPSVLKGFGTSTLYIALGLYATQKLPITGILAASGMLIIARSFIGAGVSSAIYGYLFYRQRIGHFNYLAEKSDAGNYLLHGRSMVNYRFLQEQAVLTACKDMTGNVLITGIVVLVIVAAFYALHKISSKATETAP